MSSGQKIAESADPSQKNLHPKVGSVALRAGVALSVLTASYGLLVTGAEIAPSQWLLGIVIMFLSVLFDRLTR
jgi:hypothetical protein